jgi:hypothetical protein
VNHFFLCVQLYLHTRLCHVTFMNVIRSLWYRVFVKENNLIDARQRRSFVTIKPAAEKILSDETYVAEQLSTGAQEPRVLNIYRNYLSTTQENQCLDQNFFTMRVCKIKGKNRSSRYQVGPLNVFLQDQ